LSLRRDFLPPTDELLLHEAEDDGNDDDDGDDLVTVLHESSPCSVHLHAVQNLNEQFLPVQLATAETERSTTEGNVQRGQRCNSAPGESLEASYKDEKWSLKF
jgi:hypothetical protein